MDKKTKALANGIIEECHRQKVTYEQMWRLLTELQIRYDDAASELERRREQELTEKKRDAGQPDILREFEEKFPEVEITDVPAPVAGRVNSRLNVGSAEKVLSIE